MGNREWGIENAEARCWPRLRERAREIDRTIKEEEASARDDVLPKDGKSSDADNLPMKVFHLARTADLPPQDEYNDNGGRQVQMGRGT